ncbi:hypothetical protein GTY54_19520 [Streptomyces sp. SID625]|nr:hypothetical protein [Streptomyces sp. SID625]
MTRTGKTLVVVFGVAMFFAVSLGGQYIGAGLWWKAASAYATAAVFLVGLVREIGAPLPGDYTDDVDTPAAPRRLGRWRAARQARREARATTCGCPRFWTTCGAEHDEWCPQRYRSRT